MVDAKYMTDKIDVEPLENMYALVATHKQFISQEIISYLMFDECSYF